MNIHYLSHWYATWILDNLLNHSCLCFCVGCVFIYPFAKECKCVKTLMTFRTGVDEERMSSIEFKMENKFRYEVLVPQ